MSGVPDDVTPGAAPPSTPSRKAPVPRWRRWLVDIAIVGVVIAGVSAWQQRNLLPASGEPAPEFALRDLEGNTVRLSDFDGKAVQLHFWATWCGVCRREHGALNAVARHADDARELVAIAVDSGTAEEITAYAEEKGIEYTVLVDDGSVAGRFQVSVFPTNYYLDTSHNVVGRDVGMSTRWTMRYRLWRASQKG